MALNSVIVLKKLKGGTCVAAISGSIDVTIAISGNTAFTDVTLTGFTLRTTETFRNLLSLGVVDGGPHWNATDGLFSASSHWQSFGPPPVFRVHLARTLAPASALTKTIRYCLIAVIDEPSPATLWNGEPTIGGA